MSHEPVLPAAQNAEIFGRNNVIVQIQGDGNTVVPGVAHLTLTRYLNRRRGGDGPSGEAAEILSPYALAIPFIGRESVMADLWAWMEKDQPISVRVLTARGGGGKTRLALELCDEATRQGWFAGFVTDRELQRFLAQQNLSAWGWNRPTLVVVDYAASRARLLHDWLVELADNAGDSGHPLRLLLLERYADPSMGWWLEAFGRGGGDAGAVRRLLDPAGGPFTLPTFGASERRAIFGATLKQVGSGLEPPESPEFARRLAELSWGGEPLFLMMAGLTAARAGLAHVLALSPTDVVFEVAGHEVHRIREIGKHRGIDGDFLGHMAAFVTLCQGLSRSQTEEAIAEEKQRLRYDSAGDPPRIYEALYDALPGEGINVAPVLPDPLGEAVTILALGNGDSQKAEEAVARAGALARDRVISAVIRTADDFGSVRNEVLGWLARLVKEGGEDDEVIVRIVDELPHQTLTLREAAAELTAVLVERFRQQGQRGSLADALDKLGYRLSALGRQVEALDAGQEAVSLFRELVSLGSEALRPDLAEALNNLGTLLRAVGRRNEALKAAQEALLIRRELTLGYPEAFQSDLALSLNNLAILLNDVGCRKEALAAGQEAVFLYRKLASARPEVFRQDLAMSLNNLANWLNTTGHLEEALEAGLEAMYLYRELASSRPEAFRPGLTASLSNLAKWMSAVGHVEEALEAGQEAVSLYRELALSRPEVFRPDLAMALNNLAALQSATGRREEALKSGQEAVSQHRELASSHPEAFCPELAMSLSNLAKWLSDLGLREEALEVGQEAVSQCRELASSQPEAFRPNLAMSLNNLAKWLSDLNFEEESLVAAQESVSLYRELASSHPEAFRPNLAMSLTTLAARLSCGGRWEEALEVGQEAVCLHRNLASVSPEAFRSDLACSLNNIAASLKTVGHQKEALAALQEAVSIHRELASARPGTFRSDLAMSLFNLSVFLGEAGQNDQAIESCLEAIELLIPFFLSTPATFRQLMVNMVLRYLHLVKETGREPYFSLLAPLIEAGFFETETEDSTSLDEATSGPEEEPR